MKNIILIGMPGSGKTTVGRQAARILGYQFFDVDAMVEQAAGIPIPAIFEEFGEAHFRDLESAAAHKLSRETRAVIGCGGGTILRAENMERLGHNGMIFYLNRPLEELINADLSNRPLVQNDAKRLESIYTARIELYEKYAEYTISNSGSVADVAAELVARYREQEERDEHSCD